jgi:sugar/nucleoside kinase (ribokinase family)
MDTQGAARDNPGTRFAVFGNSNMEVVIAAGQFPVPYEPSRTLPPGSIHVGVAGTAYNVGIGLWRLGHQVDLCVTQGNDPAAAFVTAAQPRDPRLRIIPLPVPRQPVTAVLTGDHGRRLIFNEAREGTWQHDPARAVEIARGCDLVVLPIGSANALLAAHAGDFGAPLACDVHAISALHGDHEPYCEAAQILFMSDERLPVPVEEWLEKVMDRWPWCRIAVVGQGARGATMAVRGDSGLHHVPAVDAGPVASTLGAGDALCAGFLDGHARGLPPRSALARAAVYAAAKIRHAGGAQGLLSASELDQLCAAAPPART